MFNLLFRNVRRDEYRKFFSTSLMFFFIAATYAITRRIKDAAILSRMDAEVITLIKVGIVLPTSILFVLIYNWASNRINKEKFAYFLQVPFLMWFLFYGLVEIINPNFFSYISLNIDSANFSSLGFISTLIYEFALVAKNFPHVMFYVITEMYGSLALSFMFWRYVNEYTKFNDVGRLYPYYALFGSISVVASGLIGSGISYLLKDRVSNESFDHTFVGINVLVAVLLIISSFYAYSISLVEHKKEAELDKIEGKKARSKVKTGFIDSIKTLFSNKTVLLLTICVLGYMASINIVEVSWKKAVKSYYLIENLDKAGFSNFQSTIQILTGITTVVAAYLCDYSLRRFGWCFAALVNPIAIGITGICFFLTIMLGSSSSKYSILYIGVVIGLIQNIASKACKYSFFDTTKEMALITLDKDLRDRGKASIDVLGGRFGKSAGSLIQQVLIAVFVPVSEISRGQELITPYLFTALCILVIFWTMAVLSLNKELIKNRSKSK